MLTAPTAEQRTTLEQCGKNQALVKRCVIKSHDGGDRLEVFFSFVGELYLHEVLDHVLRVDGWRAIAYNRKAFEALAKSCGPADFCEDYTSVQGTRSDLQVAAVKAAAVKAAAATAGSDTHAVGVAKGRVSRRDPRGVHREAARGPVGPREGCVRGTASTTSRVKNASPDQTDHRYDPDRPVSSRA